MADCKAGREASGETSRPTPWSWTAHLQNYEKISVFCLSHRCCILTGQRGEGALCGLYYKSTDHIQRLPQPHLPIPSPGMRFSHMISEIFIFCKSRKSLNFIFFIVWLFLLQSYSIILKLSNLILQSSLHIGQIISLDSIKYFSSLIW